jgi:thymidylate synthase (FAD)
MPSKKEPKKISGKSQSLLLRKKEHELKIRKLLNVGLNIESLKMSKTKRVISKGAEAWVNNPVRVLDHGFVYLVDYMGDDLAIEQAARTSYGPETKKISNSTGLIRYLLRHRHTSPIEMIDLKFHLKMPIFVARQWVRHRTASINELSGRYSILPNEFYIPSFNDIQEQSSSNNQGRGESLDAESSKHIRQTLLADAETAYQHYDEMIRSYNLARETARANLPVSIYTEFYWKINLHNLLHFLSLRLDDHAQLEIRRYAEAISEIVSDGWPVTYQAFSDYVKNSVTFSDIEILGLSRMLNDLALDSEDACPELSAREKKEFQQKISKILDANFIDYEQ